MLESMVQAVALEKLRITILPDGRMTRDDAAKYLGLKSKTLAAWHLQKRGPVSSSSEDAATIFGPSWIGSSLKARRLAREMMKDQDGGGAALNDKAADDPRGLPPPMAFTVREFCRVYGVGKTFAHNLISRGTLKKRYAGKRLLFTAASAASWFDSLPDQPPNAFTADELIAWIEDKLREQGIEKVVPTTRC